MSLPARGAGNALPAPPAPRDFEYLPAILRLQEEAPSPLPRMVLWTVLGLLAALGLWACIGKLDVVAVAEGRLCPGRSCASCSPPKAESCANCS